jgi:hypothetical protein
MPNLVGGISHTKTSGVLITLVVDHDKARLPYDVPQTHHYYKSLLEYLSASFDFIAGLQVHRAPASFATQPRVVHATLNSYHLFQVIIFVCRLSFITNIGATSTQFHLFSMYLRGQDSLTGLPTAFVAALPALHFCKWLIAQLHHLTHRLL